MTQKILLILLGIISLTIVGSAAQGQSETDVKANGTKLDVVDSVKTQRGIEAAKVNGAATVVPPLERVYSTIESDVGTLDSKLAASHATRLNAAFSVPNDSTATLRTDSIDYTIKIREQPTATIETDKAATIEADKTTTIETDKAATLDADKIEYTINVLEQPAATLDTAKTNYAYNKEAPQYEFVSEFRDGNLRVKSGDVGNKCAFAVKMLLAAGEIKSDTAEAYQTCCKEHIADFADNEIGTLADSIKGDDRELLDAINLESDKKEEAVYVSAIDTTAKANLAKSENFVGAYYNNIGYANRYDIDASARNEYIFTQARETPESESTFQIYQARPGIASASLEQQKTDLIAIPVTRSFSYLDTRDADMATAIREGKINSLKGDMMVRFVDTDGSMDELWELVECCVRKSVDVTTTKPLDDRISSSIKDLDAEINKERGALVAERAELIKSTAEKAGTSDEGAPAVDREVSKLSESIRGKYDRRTRTHRLRDVVCEEDTPPPPPPPPLSDDTTPTVVPTTPARAEACVHFARDKEIYCRDGVVKLDPSAEAEYSIMLNPWFLLDWERKEDYACYQQINELHRKTKAGKISTTEFHDRISICFNQLVKLWLKGDANLLKAFTSNVLAGDADGRHAAALALHPSEVNEIEDSTGKFYAYDNTILSSLSDGTGNDGDEPRLTLRIDQPSLTASGGCTGGSLTTHRSATTQPVVLMLFILSLVTLGAGQLTHRLRRTYAKRK